MIDIKHIAALGCAALLAAPAFAAGPKISMPNPDFTKGVTIPAGANHDWNLGATGLRGWIYSDKLATCEARQVSITNVDKGSPADGVINVGDVIPGVAGKPFSDDPRTEFGKALTAAEAGDGNLTLTRWRDGSATDVVVKLPKGVKGEDTLAFATALQRQKVPFDLHIYQKGGHGMGLAAKPPFENPHPWANNLIFWLKVQGFVR